MAATILLLGVFLAATGGALVERWHLASARRQSLSFEDQLGIVANTAGLIVITWWIMSLVIAIAAALLARCGKTRAAAATGKFSPAFMRRLVLAAVGLQLMTAPLADAATPHAATGPGQPAPAAVAAPVPAEAAAPMAVQVSEIPAPTPPPRGPSARPAVDPRWRPLPPTVDAGPLAARHMRTQDIPGAGREVTVRPGDSLWSIAATVLGPLASDADIAREWPRLYATNRGVIGDNPHLLRPGLLLTLPPDT
ncbi:LysM peptidoglycan-binding domain-containing protein [Arthrobacter sp. PM3]|uniref:LysM peptidoglycan-binding domain-containing protein n=1 Tax=Arthrobacter sp. PM3 TaxID=2017685 RepID=UPI001ABFEB58|nr:LysM domain-containing protein [Arthrobacter sp. PM3]